MTRHVSADQLARFRDGDLSRAATRRVRAHLAGCARCQADADALAGLPALLAGTPAPPMPDHLAARIEAALATESAQRAAGASGAAPARLAPGRRSGLSRRDGAAERVRRHARRPAPARRILTAAATVAVLGGGGYALVSSLGSGTSVSGTASSSSGGSIPSAEAGPAGRAPQASAAASGPVRNAPVAGSSGAVRPGAVSPLQVGPEVRYSGPGHAGRFTPVRTSTDYLAADLGQQASGTLARLRTSGPGAAGGSGHVPAGQGTTASGPAGTAGNSFSAATLAQLPGCISRVAGGQAVLLVDLASFQGAPAIIIVTAPPGSAAATQVWAVAAACSSSGADVLAHQSLP
jgi:Putative zinc-finger